MKIYSKLFMCLMLSILYSCTDSPFVSKEVIEEIEASRNPFRFIGNFVAIIDNDIYYFNRIDSLPIRITNTPNEIKTNIKLSNDRTKMVYLNSNRTPVIISREGELIATLNNYSYVKQLGWTNKDKSLYMLIGNKVHVYGEAITIKVPTLYLYDEIKSFSMNERGDYMYIINQRYSTYRRDLLHLNSPEKGIDTIISSFYPDRTLFNYASFTGDNGSFVIGEKLSNDRINNILIISQYDFNSADHWINDPVYSPVYDDNKEVLLFGTGYSEYFVKAVYLGLDGYKGVGLEEIKNKELEQFPSKKTIYIDWKQ